MGSLTFSLSLDDGRLSPSAAVMSSPVRWTEADIQNVLVLNPELLSVVDHSPVQLSGDSTAVSPDQVYVDDVGRFVIVEVKNETANLTAIGQLLSYAYQWQVGPIGEIEPRLERFSTAGALAEVAREALSGIRQWAGKRAVKGARGGAARDALGHSPVVRPYEQRVLGAPARMVLIAPAFTDETLRLAQVLSARFVAIELIRASLGRAADGEVVLTWDRCVTSEPSLELVWDAGRRLWRSFSFREGFAPNAWAEHLSREAFSYSARAAPAARIYLEHVGTTLNLSTSVPDGWYSELPRRRSKLRAEFVAMLPTGHSGGRWLTWSFTMPAEARAFEECAEQVACAIRTVLVPARPAP